MKNKKLIKREDAVAGVIEALLLVALVAIIISTLQLVYIPQIMEQRESDHMDDAENQFSYLKSVIDLQSMVKEDVPISSPITLGSRELPYFVTARAFGELEIINNSNKYNITVNPPLSGPSNKGVFNLTSIKYQAYNAYYVDQTYILEGGGIIRNQSTGMSTMIVYPSISVKNESKINISFYFPEISGKEEKTTRYGHENYFIRTDYSTNETNSGDVPNGGHIRIYTDYLDAWNDSLHILLDEEDLIKGGYVKVNITQEPSKSPFVEITPTGGKNIHLEFTVAYIEAQIGPGWT